MTVFVVDIPDTVPPQTKVQSGKTAENRPSCCCLPLLKYYKVIVFVLLLVSVMALVHFYILSSEKFDYWKKILIVGFFLMSFLLGVFSQSLYADIKDGKHHPRYNLSRSLYPKTGAFNYPPRHHEFMSKNGWPEDSFPPPTYDEADKLASKYHTAVILQSTPNATT